jgi:hypothetical protein
MFVIFESATNPYVNNPIGIFVWIVSLVGLDVITDEHHKAVLPMQSILSCLDERGISE